jgi:hypothetical protein
MFAIAAIPFSPIGGSASIYQPSSQSDIESIQQHVQ